MRASNINMSDIGQAIELQKSNCDFVFVLSRVTVSQCHKKIPHLWRILKLRDWLKILIEISGNFKEIMFYMLGCFLTHPVSLYLALGYHLHVASCLPISSMSYGTKWPFLFWCVVKKLLTQFSIDSATVNAFKNGLRRTRNNKMGFFVDQLAGAYPEICFGGINFLGRYKTSILVCNSRFDLISTL